MAVQAVSDLVGNTKHRLSPYWSQILMETHLFIIMKDLLPINYIVVMELRLIILQYAAWDIAHQCIVFAKIDVQFVMNWS